MSDRKEHTLVVIRPSNTPRDISRNNCYHGGSDKPSAGILYLPENEMLVW